MQRWEYLSVQVGAGAIGDGRARNHPLGERLGKLGEQGWELATGLLTDDPKHAVLVFKRPRSSDDNNETVLTLRMDMGGHKPLTPPLASATR